jgi:hypothetical protein
MDITGEYCVYPGKRQGNFTGEWRSCYSNDAQLHVEMHSKVTLCISHCEPHNNISLMDLASCGSIPLEATGSDHRMPSLILKHFHAVNMLTPHISIMF